MNQPLKNYFMDSGGFAPQSKPTFRNLIILAGFNELLLAGQVVSKRLECLPYFTLGLQVSRVGCIVLEQPTHYSYTTSNRDDTKWE